MKTIVIEVLVAAAVLIVAVSVLGMLRMRDPYQRMHYIAPPASLSAIFITVAIFLQQGFKAESFKAAFTTLVLIAMNTLVTHAAVRTFRIAEVKDWQPAKDEEVPLKSSDELVRSEAER
ncbi:MAG TPA: monovalent cation/H(+) antiporter subunit G [Terriglobales bacterium]|jgi:multisubunit Na+/H+ antiporter MnhG subunit|nr:monovalent cation/H(+) antiporter subunit G [Terriglobales bacterium]